MSTATSFEPQPITGAIPPPPGITPSPETAQNPVMQPGIVPPSIPDAPQPGVEPNLITGTPAEPTQPSEAPSSNDLTEIPTTSLDGQTSSDPTLSPAQTVEPASPSATEPNLSSLSGSVTEQLTPPEGSKTPLTATFMKFDEMIKGAGDNEALRKIILSSAQRVVDEVAKNEEIPPGSVQADSSKAKLQ
ncbi:MAG: hypothetical protein HYW63_02260 [Candidatus Levybacteria bacterium]|nr:hypothetical protein [Candidatus Levybacteria bacterium]